MFVLSRRTRVSFCVDDGIIVSDDDDVIAIFIAEL